MTDALAPVAAPVVRLRPDFEVAGVLARTGKSLILAGTLAQEAGAAVVAKVLIDHAPIWARNFAREIDVYRTFVDVPPPVRVPRLFAASEADGVLVIERYEGRHPSGDRYPAHPLRDDDVRAMVGTLVELGRWPTPAGALRPATDYRDRLHRYWDHGLLDQQEHDALRNLLEVAGADLRPGHGDPLPSNFLFDDGATPILLDWEFGGLYLPGHDLAVLWTLLSRTHAARRHVEATAAAGSVMERAAFDVNRAVVLAREIRIHREVPPADWVKARTAALARDWARLRAELGLE